MPELRPIRRRAVPASALWALLAAASAGAYILPASSILRRMSEARNDVQISNLRIDGTLTFASSAAREAATLFGGGGSEIQVDGVLMLKLPSRCRLEVSTEVARGAVVWSHGKQRTEGVRLDELAVALAQICPLLATRSGSETATRAAVEHYLSSMNVQSKTSLGRLGRQIAYVLGQPADGEPQLWVYKDNFLPARIRWTDADKRHRDLRFLDYGSPLTGEAFPRVIELYREGELLLRFSGLKSDSKAGLAEKLF